VQLAHYALAGGGETLTTLADAGRAGEGPFADHLRSHRVALEADEALRRGVAQVLAERHLPELSRLLAAPVDGARDGQRSGAGEGPVSAVS
jgi:hypothetical protein